MPDEKFSSRESENAIEHTAAAWLARCDRGLTPAEQDEFLQWRRDDPRHAAALARLEKTWGALDALAAEWRPEHSARPNPDLLAATARGSGWRRWWLFPVGLAAAAAAALMFFPRGLEPAANPPVPRRSVVRIAPPATTLTHSGMLKHEPERITLPDGSVVDLNAGAKIEVAFVTEERRVRLLSGEAHFTVTKNPARPFVVAAAGVAVRAVGTAFSVELGEASVAVLVTEGRVRLDQPAGGPTGEPGYEAPVLLAGQRAVIETSAPAAAPVVAAVTATEMERALAWQGVRLEFVDMPLAEVAAEFNHHNVRQLVVDPAVAGLRVGGNFRAENVDAFVRLLESSFGVAAGPRPDGATVLRRR